MKLSAARALVGFSALLALGGLALARPDSGYHLLNTYTFGLAPGSTGEYFDYVTVDPSARRVYLGRGTAIEVMDADSGALVGYVSGFKRQHGVALAPEFNRGFMGYPTVSAVPPRHHHIFPLDRRLLFGLLDDETPVEPAPQTGDVQRVDASALNLHRGQPQSVALPLCIAESGEGTGEEKRAQYGQEQR